MKVLVTGGAGYIGSFMVKQLLDEGHSVVVVDTLTRGRKDRLDSRAEFIEGNITERHLLDSVFTDYQFDAVMHFAAYIAVGESMERPGMYFQNNLMSTIQLLEAMQVHGVKNFIFSSTGTVYGTPEENPIPETHPKNPENPYAESKWMVERILHWYHEIYGISYSVLRYFNASGAALDGSMGEDHNPETHLIPNAMRAASEKKVFTLFGDNYDTKDGTCVRDYIHVLDLVQAHMLTLTQMQKFPGAYTYNVGTGKGITNREIIDAVQKVSGVSFLIDVQPRREGDVAETVADSTLLRTNLGFSPQYSDLDTIISSAWKWHQKLSQST